VAYEIVVDMSAGNMNIGGYVFLYSNETVNHTNNNMIFHCFLIVVNSIQLWCPVEMFLWSFVGNPFAMEVKICVIPGIDTGMFQIVM
jgi:hypothetical protein